MTEARNTRLAYVEARLIRDDDAALCIARNNENEFFWLGETPWGWEDGSDWLESERDELVAAGRIVWDDEADQYRLTQPVAA